MLDYFAKIFIMKKSGSSDSFLIVELGNWSLVFNT